MLLPWYVLSLKSPVNKNKANNNNSNTSEIPIGPVNTINDLHMRWQVVRETCKRSNIYHQKGCYVPKYISVIIMHFHKTTFCNGGFKEIQCTETGWWKGQDASVSVTDGSKCDLYYILIFLQKHFSSKV